jgi:hypothetical protein
MNYQAPAIKTKTKGDAFFNTSRLFLLKITIYYDSVHCVECFTFCYYFANGPATFAVISDDGAQCATG